MARMKRRASRKNRSRSRSFSRPLIKKRLISQASNFVLRLLPFILIAVLAGLAFKAGTSLLFHSDHFRIKTVRVTGEKFEGRLKSGEIELSSKKGQSIFAVNLKEFESEIRDRHPELKDLRVRRILPDTLEVSYKIRRPFCQLDSGYFYLVSDDAVIFPKPLVAAEPGLPIITGLNITDRLIEPGRRSRSKVLEKAIALLREVGESDFSKRHKVIRINIYDPRSPSIYIEDETRIEIGEYSFKEREKVLEEVLDDLESKNKKAKIIDLRFKDVVVIPR